MSKIATFDVNQLIAKKVVFWANLKIGSPQLAAVVKAQI